MPVVEQGKECIKVNKDISSEIISTVKSSYGRCLNNPEFLDDFYDNFLGSHPDIRRMFASTDSEKQKTLFKHGLNMMIAYASGSAVGQSVLERIRESHNSSHLNVRPDMYRYWLKSLINTVSRNDDQFNSGVQKSWEDVLSGGIEFISTGWASRTKSA